MKKVLDLVIEGKVGIKLQHKEGASNQCSMLRVLAELDNVTLDVESEEKKEKKEERLEIIREMIREIKKYSRGSLIYVF